MTSLNGEQDAVAVMDDDPNVVGTSAWIERDQYVYFVTLAHELGNPADWQTFREALVGALRAAWGIDTIWLHLDTAGQRERRASRIASAYEVVDSVRIRYDPAEDWGGFFDALWSARLPLTGTTPRT